MLDLTASRPRVAPAGHAPAQLALAVHGAIGAALRRVPDLVLTEVDVPVSGGIEATRRIKAELPATHVVMLTPGPPERRPGPFSPPPPDREASLTEIAVLGELAAERDAAAIDGINYWNTGAPAFRWNNRTVQLLLAKGITVPRASRAMALLNVAIHDATVAAWDTKYTYNRARPADFERGFVSAIPTPASPAYPSEHAVTAGAAEAVLSYLFPDDAVMVNGWAEEAGRSRTLAGTDYPSDVAAGLELGRQVGAVVVDWAKNDGTTATWTGTVPTGPGMWVGTNSAEPLAGTWKTWALSAGNQFRPGPRAAYDSAELRQELDDVKNFPRTNFTNLNASYWEYYGGRASCRGANCRAGLSSLVYS